MKLLHICNDYRDNNLYEHMFSGLEKYGWNQDVFVPYRKELDLVRKSEYRIIQSKCYNNIDRILYSKKSDKIYKKCIELIDIKQIKLIHAHTLFSTGSVAYKLKQFNNIRYIVSVRGTDVNVFFKKMKHLRRKGIDILLEAEKIIFVSKSIQENLLEFIKEDKIKNKIIKNSVIVTNGIDDIWFDNYKTSKIIKKELELVHTGWINNNKNQLTSIKAVEKLNKLGISCKLSIIGGVENSKDKKYYNKIINYINNSEYKDKFILMGRKTKQEIIDIYEDKHIFLLPSKHETFGLVYIEALTQRLPIIYSKGQGVDGIFEDGRMGYRVAALNEAEIVDAVKKITENYEKIQNNINNDLEVFKWNNICKVIDGIYKEV